MASATNLHVNKLLVKSEYEYPNLKCYHMNICLTEF